MHSLFASAGTAPAIPVWPVTKAGLDAWLASQPAHVAAWTQANQFRGQAGRVLKIASADGELADCYG